MKKPTSSDRPPTLKEIIEQYTELEKGLKRGTFDLMLVNPELFNKTEFLKIVDPELYKKRLRDKCKKMKELISERRKNPSGNTREGNK